MTYSLLTSARVAVAPFGVRMPLTCSRHSRHVYACPRIFRFRMRRKLPSHRFALHGSGFLPSRVESHSLNSLYPSRRGGLSCAHSETVSYVAAARAAFSCSAHSEAVSYVAAARAAFSCSAHSEAVSYSCNAALAVGIPFLVGCNPKLVCPATLMLFSVGTVPASGGTPTL